jgi:hypothetical protein
MRWLSVFAVLICLAVAGCGNSDNRPEDNRFGGFYGGVNGGVMN